MLERAEVLSECSGRAHGEHCEAMYWKMHDRAVNQLFFLGVGKSAPVSVEFDCPSSTAMILDFLEIWSMYTSRPFVV